MYIYIYILCVYLFIELIRTREHMGQTLVLPRYLSMGDGDHSAARRADKPNLLRSLRQRRCAECVKMVNCC